VTIQNKLSRKGTIPSILALRPYTSAGSSKEWIDPWRRVTSFICFTWHLLLNNLRSHFLPAWGRRQRKAPVGVKPTMTAGQAYNDEVMRCLVRDATSKIAQAVQCVASQFITSGGYGFLSMHIAINEVVADIFRSAASMMALQARRDAGGYSGTVDAVEARLFDLLTRTIEQRSEHLASGKLMSQDATMLCADLAHDLKRAKDAVVRSLRHCFSDVAIGVDTNVVTVMPGHLRQ
jgi:hypothetical protein